MSMHKEDWDAVTQWLMDHPAVIGCAAAFLIGLILGKLA